MHYHGLNVSVSGMEIVALTISSLRDRALSLVAVQTTWQYFNAALPIIMSVIISFHQMLCPFHAVSDVNLNYCFIFSSVVRFLKNPPFYSTCEVRVN